jgi:hypothetical protein
LVEGAAVQQRLKRERARQAVVPSNVVRGVITTALSVEAFMGFAF